MMHLKCATAQRTTKMGTNATKPTQDISCCSCFAVGGKVDGEAVDGVGDTDGRPVGSAVGGVGETDGKPVGDIVGDIVGDAVGKLVSTGVIGKYHTSTSVLESLSGAPFPNWPAPL